jgi:hypothetical protein
MAAIPVTFQGVLFFSDLGIGGGPMPGGPYPSHPIAPGGPPPQIWPSPGVPTHPIAPGGPPPTIWPSPGVPTHPIYFPPPGSPPPLGIWGPPDMPPGFWGGSLGPGVKPQPHPEHPIVLPPNLPPEIPPPEGGGPAIPIEWKTGWTPTTGWVVVGVPTVPHPTPSS